MSIGVKHLDKTTEIANALREGLIQMQSRGPDSRETPEEGNYNSTHGVSRRACGGYNNDPQWHRLIRRLLKTPHSGNIRRSRRLNYTRENLTPYLARGLSLLGYL